MHWSTNSLIFPMEHTNLSRQEYTARINRVMDYIGLHIEKQVDLSEMARIAAFSPYHFHRIFTYIVGETPNGFVSRIKLEKAAQLLHDCPRTAVSEIAYQCGFSSISSFSRAFTGYFGISASAFRQEAKAIFIKDGVRYSKNCQPMRKIGKQFRQVNEQFCSVELKQLLIMDTKISVKEMPAMNLIYCRHMGAFNQIGRAYEKLFAWAGPRGLVSPDTKTVTVYHDDPSITSVEKVRQDASLIVEGDVKVEGEIGKFALPGGRYAVGRFELKETEFEQAWNTMCAWLTDSGFQPGEGCTYELYHNHYSEAEEHRFIVDICIPVKPL